MRGRLLVIREIRYGISHAFSALILISVSECDNVPYNNNGGPQMAVCWVSCLNGTER